MVTLPSQEHSMRSSTRTLLPALVLAVAALTACAKSPTEPELRLKTGLFLDGVPCDSTIVTDGSCRGGWIIPWNLQGR